MLRLVLPSSLGKGKSEIQPPKFHSVSHAMIAAVLLGMGCPQGRCGGQGGVRQEESDLKNIEQKFGQIGIGMTEQELSLINEQLELRRELEAKCEEKGWTLKDVYFSDVEYYANPDQPDFTWHNKRDTPKDAWLVKLEEKGEDQSRARLKPRIKVEYTKE